MIPRTTTSAAAESAKPDRLLAQTITGFYLHGHRQFNPTTNLAARCIMAPRKGELLNVENSRKIDQAAELIRQAERIAVLSGAGVSAESGVSTYRGAGGIWSGFSAEELASPQGFARDPGKVWRWHDERRMGLRNIQPNAAHRALAELQHRLEARGGSFVLATQNIDGLHQAAGSNNVLELHGTILAIHCSACSHRRHIGFEAIDEGLPRCPNCGEFMRPDIVWFGEQLPQDVWTAAARAAGACRLFMTIGTSAVVYPAAGLIEIAIAAGAKTIEVNLEETPASHAVDIALHGQAGDLLPRLLS